MVTLQHTVGPANRSGLPSWDFAPPSRELRDLIWLVALGLTSRHPSSLEDVCFALECLTTEHWLPPAHHVETALEDMDRSGHLTPIRSALRATRRYVVTESGRQILIRLLIKPIDTPCALHGQVALRLKLAFLDLLPPEPRRALIACLIQDYEAEVDTLAQQPAHTAPTLAVGEMAPLLRRHDAARLRDDLDLLRDVAALMATE